MEDYTKRNEHIVQLHNENLTLRQIGEKVGLSVERVRQILGKFGLKSKQNAGWPKGKARPEYTKGRQVSRDKWTIEMDNKILELFDKGWSLARIAESIGMSREAVKGRSWRLRNARSGEKLPRGSETGYVKKLTIEQRREIRETVGYHTELARKFNVSVQTIIRIRNLPEWIDEPGRRSPLINRPSGMKRPEVPTKANLNWIDGRKAPRSPELIAKVRAARWGHLSPAREPR